MLNQTTDVGEVVALGEVVVLFGPPAGGKTGPRLALEAQGFHGGVSYDIVMKSTNGSLKSIADKAKLWSDSVVIPAVTNHLAQKPRSDKHVLDGFPRTLRQALALLGFCRVFYGQGAMRIVELLVPYEDCRERAANRTKQRILQDLPPRADDNLKRHRKRFGEYNRYSQEVLSFYHKEGITIYQIDGCQSEEKVCKDVLEVVLH